MNNADQYKKVLNNTLEHAYKYIENTEEYVGARKSLAELRKALQKSLTEDGQPPEAVIDQLVKDVDGGLLTNTGGRFFAWVIGGSLPGALAADWLTSTWDQNAGMYACSPAASVIEEVAGNWLKEIFGLPKESSFAFTTGCQMAHVTALAAARNEVLQKQNWNVEAQGLSGGPKIHILTNKLRHMSFDRAVRFLGMGTDNIIPIEVDGIGRIVKEKLIETLESVKGEPIILQLCAGEINTGAFDNFAEVIPIAHSYQAWVHVDGAFGLWANTSRKLNHMLTGVEEADSWATDGHKWLNVPYDCGYAFVRNNRAHKASMSMHASYLNPDDQARDQIDWNLEMSRRGRGISTYAAIRELGTKGISDMIENSCNCARKLVESIGSMEGASLMWKPTINQGLVRFLVPNSDLSDVKNDLFTDTIISRINQTGKLFVGGTKWKGLRCMRVSVSGWQTNEEDIQISLKAIKEVLKDELAKLQ